jgi:hypothetical protein
MSLKLQECCAHETFGNAAGGQDSGEVGAVARISGWWQAGT